MELVIEPTIVWMVHLDRGTPDEIEGTLSADEWELVFTDAASPETARFPFVDIVSVKRVLGSPVFTVGWRRGDETRRAAAAVGNARLARRTTERPRPHGRHPVPPERTVAPAAREHALPRGDRGVVEGQA